jgi:hypothetical protein
VTSDNAFGYFGHRLFRIGFYERSGELRAHFGEHRLLLKAVAPGVFFALFTLQALGIQKNKVGCAFFSETWGVPQSTISAVSFSFSADRFRMNRDQRFFRGDLGRVRTSFATCTFKVFRKG